MSYIVEFTPHVITTDPEEGTQFSTEIVLANDIHPLMVQENYANNIMGINDQLKRLDNLAYSAYALSDTDIFETQVNMAKWEFEPYVGLSIINAASKCNKKAMIKFPQYLGRVSMMYKNRRERVNYDDVKFFDNTVEKCVPKKMAAEKVSDETKEKKPRGRPKKAK